MRVSTFFLLIYLSIPSSSEQAKCRRPVDAPVKNDVADICVYGINDDGELFYNTNGRDNVRLTLFAMIRRNAIEKMTNYDDINTGIYTPISEKSTAIFFISCKKCSDFWKLKDFKLSDLKVFLLSVYVQRMKPNLKYHIADYNKTLFENGHSQPLPMISTTPFWENRLHFNTSCAPYSNNRTLTHFIPHFAGQRYCVLDFQKTFPLSTTEATTTKTTTHLIVSWTLSYNSLYKHGVISYFEHSDKRDSKTCKLLFEVSPVIRRTRYFCVCGNARCLGKVYRQNQGNICPPFTLEFTGVVGNDGLSQYTDYESIDNFFLNKKKHCLTIWQVKGRSEKLSLRSCLPTPTPESPQGNEGYMYSADNYHCPFNNNSDHHGIPISITTKHDHNSPSETHRTFIRIIAKHVNFTDSLLLGANCSAEGGLSNPTYSNSRAASNSSYFPCYYHTELDSGAQVFPLMGINMAPVDTVKGKNCYYMTVKLSLDHLLSCSRDINIDKFVDPALMTIVSCPMNVSPDPDEKKFIQELNQACPETFWNEAEQKWQWKYVKTSSNLCAQIVTGLRNKDGVYLPLKVELRGIKGNDGIIDDEDFLNTTFPLNQMIKSNDDDPDISRTQMMTLHGCGFNVEKKLTICTCSPLLGGCYDIYTVGRLHVLKYLPLSEQGGES